GQTDSRATRQMVAALITEMPAISVSELIRQARGLGFISVEEPRSASGADVIAQLRSLLAVTELDDLALESRLDSYAHQQLARLMKPIREEALRLFDGFELAQEGRRGAILSQLRSESERALLSCSEVTACVEQLRSMRVASPSLPAVLSAADTYINDRAEAIRRGLDGYAQRTLPLQVNEVVGVPAETREQMVEDLQQFAQFLVETSRMGLIRYSSRSLHFESPYNDRSVFSSSVRLFRERSIFFRSQTLHTSLDYPVGEYR
ncbi:MAG: hypothetical protein EBZ48_17100, partial [Proteobacteria bacterium]|nr:hypothetical protein [Pseudomonadota bacterium]